MNCIYPRRSLFETSSDALAACIGVSVGLYSYSRDIHEFFGGCLVLFLLFSAVSNATCAFPESMKPESSSSIRIGVATFFSWALLWTMFATLEFTTPRWFTSLIILYIGYFSVRGWQADSKSVIIVSLAGLGICIATSRQFMFHFGADQGLWIVIGCHLVWWMLLLKLKPINLQPKIVLLDAPLLSIRSIFVTRKNHN